MFMNSFTSNNEAILYQTHVAEFINQQHLSPSSQQLGPSALTEARRAAEWPNLSSQISSVSHLPFPNICYALKRHMDTVPIYIHYLRAFDNRAKIEKNKDSGKCKTGAMWFDLRFPAGPELSKPLIGSCNSALI